MVRTRIPPSPTGQDLHIGNLQTALINYAFAKKHGGKFIVRIEDTDRERLVEGSDKRILETLQKYGLMYDEGPFYQSQRLELYQKYARELIKKRKAYYCFCTKERLDEMRKKQQQEKKIPKYDRYCLLNVKDVEERIKRGEKYVVRMRVPDGEEIVFNDVVRGEIKFQSDIIDDQVLLKSDGYPTYHLAVVVDDNLMEITHVIRGEDWIPSTPKHILLYKYFGWELPVFAHTSLLRNPDHSKLSKRKNPVWASWYLEQGYLAEAILNYLALMGWSHPEGKELFDLQEYIKVFDLKDMQSVGPTFDIVKLEWMNGEYIRKMETLDLKSLILDFYNRKYPEELVEKTIPLIKERIKKFSDYIPLCEFFFKRPEKYEIDLSSKKELVQKVYDELSTIDQWNNETIGKKMQTLVDREGVKTGEFFMTLRVVITGKKISPPLNDSMEILGKEECLMRLEFLVSS